MVLTKNSYIMATNIFEKALQAGHGCNKNGHFKYFLDNVYQGVMPSHFIQMFLNGSGKELKNHATAIHSSSMLAYNHFHWISQSHPLFYNGAKYTEVYFELRLWTLKTSKQAPANMDVVLVGKKNRKTCILFIESKFTEFLSRREFKLSESYLDSNNCFESEQAKELCKCLKDNYDQILADCSVGYGEGVKQGITHLYGLMSLYNNEAFDYFKNQLPYNSLAQKLNGISDAETNFINLLFEPKSDFRDDYKSYCNYKELYDNLIGKLAPQKYEMVSYSDLWEGKKDKKSDNPGLKTQINGFDTCLKDFLWQRYMRFAEGTTE